MKLKSSIVFKGKAGAAHEPIESRLLAVRDLFGDQQREEIAIAPLFLLAPRQVAPRASRVGQVQRVQEGSSA